MLLIMLAVIMVVILHRRHSISCYIFALCANAISWKASLQSIAVLSTTEAEYVAAIEGVKEAIRLRCLLIELGAAQGTTIVFSDSQSAIHLTKNDFHSKIKNIIAKYHFVQDVIAAREIVIYEENSYIE